MSMAERTPESVALSRRLAMRRRLERLARISADADRDPTGYAGEALSLHRALAEYFAALDFAIANREFPGVVESLELAERALRAISDWPMPAGPVP